MHDADAGLAPSPAARTQPRDKQRPSAPASRSAGSNGRPSSNRVRDLAPLIAAPTDGAADGPCWRGTFSQPASASAFAAVCRFVGGMGDLTAMLAGTLELEIKGRLAVDKLESFFEQVKVSKSRTATLGVLSCSEDASPLDHLALTELLKTLSSGSRTGVCGGFAVAGIEGWVLPKGPLSARLLRTASLAAAGSASAHTVPENVAPTELLLVTLHRKGWAPPRRPSPVQQPAASSQPQQLVSIAPGLPALPASLLRAADPRQAAMAASSSQAPAPTPAVIPMASAPASDPRRAAAAAAPAAAPSSLPSDALEALASLVSSAPMQAAVHDPRRQMLQAGAPPPPPQQQQPNPQQPQPQPSPSYSTGVPAAPESHPQPPPPAGQQAPAATAATSSDLDLSGLGALAAALGVLPAEAQAEALQPPPPPPQQQQQQPAAPGGSVQGLSGPIGGSMPVSLPAAPLMAPPGLPQQPAMPRYGSNMAPQQQMAQPSQFFMGLGGFAQPPPPPPRRSGQMPQQQQQQTLPPPPSRRGPRGKKPGRGSQRQSEQGMLHSEQPPPPPPRPSASMQQRLVPQQQQAMQSAGQLLSGMPMMMQGQLPMQQAAGSNLGFGMQPLPGAVGHSSLGYAAAIASSDPGQLLGQAQQVVGSMGQPQMQQMAMMQADFMGGAGQQAAPFGQQAPQQNMAGGMGQLMQGMFPGAAPGMQAQPYGMIQQPQPGGGAGQQGGDGPGA